MVGIPKSWRLGQDDEPVDRDVFSDSLVPCRSDITTAVVIAISRNVDGTASPKISLAKIGEPSHTRDLPLREGNFRQTGRNLDIRLGSV